MNAVSKQQYPKVSYTQTQLGGGVTSQGIAYPGGIDLTTPTLRLNPGTLRDGLNFECSQSGGYSRIVGYERFDGQASPSDATYQIIQLVGNVADFTDDFTDDFLTETGDTPLPNVGDTVVHDVTDATCLVISVVDTEAKTYIVLTMVTGVFDTISYIARGFGCCRHRRARNSHH